MTDILRQVDEDLRKERLSYLWKRYGLYSITFVVILIILVVGYQLKSSFDRQNNEQLVELYLSATNNQQIDQQISLLAELKNFENNYLSHLADLRISNLLIKDGNEEEGKLILEKLSKNNEIDPMIRDLAIYYLLMINLNDFSEYEFESYLNDIRIEDSRFKFLFKELFSIKKLLLGSLDESKNEFQELINLPEVPIAIKARAAKFIEIIN